MAFFTAVTSMEGLRSAKRNSRHGDLVGVLARTLLKTWRHDMFFQVRKALRLQLLRKYADPEASS